jgi:hypothetical protein
LALAEHGRLIGSSEALEAIENEIDVALDTERDALLGVFRAASAGVDRQGDVSGRPGWASAIPS